jgi:hypothetical protein
MPMRPWALSSYRMKALQIRLQIKEQQTFIQQTESQIG